tara:strand:- start:1100 stop:1732 length:633 start_codon:yes stop_codon:yes gene_type:complete
MANVKISALQALTNPAGTDVIPITDVSGTPTTKKVTVTNLMGLAPVQTSDLGTSAALNVGTAATNVVQLSNVGGTVKLPAVDGSQLTNISATVSAEELRGTDNPHIGAFPNQSFLVIDNPTNSVMLTANADGTISVITSTGAKNLSVGFSVVEDATEPDIEVASGGDNYSVISGDSDSLGPNGLPIRQGFNLPDIGANPAPLLISGGSIV